MSKDRIVSTGIALGLASFATAMPINVFAQEQANTTPQVNTTALDDQGKAVSEEVVPEVIVTARRQDVKSKIDRRIYDVSKTPKAAVVEDVIASLPGVTIDTKDNIVIHGDNRTVVMIDGKVIPKDVLMQLPAGIVASAEVITNPSAQYSSSASAIINIVTRKSNKPGFRRFVSLSADTLGKVSASASGTYIRGKWSANADLNFRQNHSKAAYDTVRDWDAREGRTAGGSHEAYNAWLRSERPEAVANLTYSFDANTRITATTIRSALNISTSSLGHFEISSPNDVSEAAYNTDDRSKTRQRTEIDNLSYDRNDALSGKHLSVDFTRVHNLINKSDTQQYTYTKPIMLPTNNQVGDEYEINSSSLNLKYERYFTSDQILTTGGKVASEKNEFKNTVKNIPGIGNMADARFVVRRSDAAAFATYQMPLATWLVMPGLRFESTHLSLSVPGNAENWKNNYDKVLPSLHVSHAVGDNSKVTASYSRRTDIFTNDQLNPALVYSGARYARRGNPNLRPADRDDYEINYEFGLSGQSTLLTLYQKRTYGDINPLSSLLNDDVLVETYINAGQSNNVGAEAVFKGKIGKKLTYTVDLEAYAWNIDYTGADLRAYRSSHTTSNAKTDFLYQASRNDKYTFQINFQGKYYGLDSEYSPRVLSLFSYEHTFPNKATFTVDLVNSFQSDVTTQITNTAGLRQVARTVSPARALRISFARNF